MSSKFTCKFCKEQFDVPKGLYKHLQSAHTAGTSRDNRTCPICGVLCLKYEGYRDHLLYIHGQTDEGLKLTFKSLNEFLVWKAELELKHNCKYVLQSSPKVLPSKEKKYFYQCNGSDSKEKKDKKSLSVVMKTCSSVISVVEYGNVFKVEYWDIHSGHSQTLSTPTLQTELEAAISSVEMVNAIADSDDSYDRSEDMLASANPSPSVSNIEKQSLNMNSNSPSNINNLNNLSMKKSSIMKPSIKIDGSKKKNPNAVLFSLASVACGKGISKKPSAKTDENKDSSNITPENSKNVIEQVDESSVSVPELRSGNSVSPVPVTVAPLKNSVILSSTTVTTTTNSLSGSTKTVSSGFPAIAPKITSASNAISASSYTTINSLINTNNTFPNQLVIVNPVGLDQNSLNSKQNVLTTGQNILLSLGSPGQNIMPAVSQSLNVTSVGDKNTANLTNNKKKKLDAPKMSSVLSLSPTVSKNNTSSATSVASSTAPVTLKSGLNSTPVILSSLPIGSTFMSVNNSLIPIATPSGTFLPTSLPPNVVLTPVVSSTSITGTNATQKTSDSITNSVKTTVPNVQSQMRFTPASTVAITVSSIVKEPIYSTSAVKQMSNIAASSTMPISPASSIKTYSKNQSNSVPTTISDKISPLKNINKFMTSTPVKSKSILSSINTKEITVTVKKNTSCILNKVSDNVPSSKGSSTSNSILKPAVTVPSVSSPKNRTSARKSISIVKPKSSKISETSASVTTSATTTLSSLSNTKVVNSQLNLAPISSTTIAAQSIDTKNPGTLFFESSGDIFMLEPVSSDAVSTKSVGVEAVKRKIDRSVQTNEYSNLKPNLKRKRTSIVNEDSNVLLKVKCYQLEMKYMNALSHLKRCKIALAKAKIRNAELTGLEAPDASEEDMSQDTSRSQVSQIMEEIEEICAEKRNVNMYTLRKTSEFESLYEDLEESCTRNIELNKELESYRSQDKFFKNLRKKMQDEEYLDLND